MVRGSSRGYLCFRYPIPSKRGFRSTPSAEIRLVSYRAKVKANTIPLKMSLHLPNKFVLVFSLVHTVAATARFGLKNDVVI